MVFVHKHFENISLLYDKKKDILYSNNDNFKTFQTLDEYDSQQKKCGMPPKHGGLYKIITKHRNIQSSKNIFNNVLFVPISSIGGHNLCGPWHMMHHFFLFYNNISTNDIKDIDNILFYLFTSREDGKREKKIIQLSECPKYLKLFYDILKVDKDWEIFKEEHKKIHDLFYQNKEITVNNLNVLSVNLNNFDNKNLFTHYMDKFKETMYRNYGLGSENEKNIIIVCRREKRAFVNQEEIRQWIGDYCLQKNINFKMIYLEDYSFQEQFKFFSNAKVVLGVHGAGLTWCTLMEKNSHLIEIFPKGGGHKQFNDYLWFCDLSQVNYHRIIDNYEGNIQNFRDCNIILSKEKILRELDNILVE